MPMHSNAEQSRSTDYVTQDILLILIPGVGIQESDFRKNGVISAVEQRGWPVKIVTIDPGIDAYLDGSLESHLLQLIDQSKREAGASRVWLAGISLGCQAVLRCARLQPEAAEGVMLITPYVATTGLIAEVSRAGGLENWAKLNSGRTEADRALLIWLAMQPPLQMMLGLATGDRFAATAGMLADLLPPYHTVRVNGEHNWDSWIQLWHLMLDKDPFLLNGG